MVEIALQCYALFYVDFLEGYTYQPQIKVQSMYHHSSQLTIMVRITYRHNP